MRSNKNTGCSKSPVSSHLQQKALLSEAPADLYQILKEVLKQQLHRGRAAQTVKDDRVLRPKNRSRKRE